MCAPAQQETPAESEKQYCPHGCRLPHFSPTSLTHQCRAPAHGPSGQPVHQRCSSPLPPHPWPRSIGYAGLRGLLSAVSSPRRCRRSSHMSATTAKATPDGSSISATQADFCSAPQTSRDTRRNPQTARSSPSRNVCCSAILFIDRSAEWIAAHGNRAAAIDSPAATLPIRASSGADHPSQRRWASPSRCAALSAHVRSNNEAAPRDKAHARSPARQLNLKCNAIPARSVATRSAQSIIDRLRRKSFIASTKDS